MPLKDRILMLRKRVPVVIAGFWYRIERTKRRLEVVDVKYRGRAIVAAVVVCIALTVWMVPAIEAGLSEEAAKNLVIPLGAFLVGIGGALVGASAISFSFVMFAMQINVERLPHGLFFKFSSDKSIMGSFAGILLLSISIAASSLIVKAATVVPVCIYAAWATAIVFLVIIFTYRRALTLINPIKQLEKVAIDASGEFSRWERLGRISRPLFPVDEGGLRQTVMLGQTSVHDLPLAAFWQTNRYWTARLKTLIEYCVSFARRYGEQGDQTVSKHALLVIVTILRDYVRVKGLTFFADNILIQNPLATDGFINNVNEELRQLLSAAIARKDEPLTEQTLETYRSLAVVLVEIDYCDATATKHHAHLAISHLTSGVEDALRHQMTDVVMRGLSLMRWCGSKLTAKERPNEIATVVEKIGLISAAGTIHERLRPVTLIGMEQFAALDLELLVVQRADIAFAVQNIRRAIILVVTTMLQVSDPRPMVSIHSTYLAPYFSGTSVDAFEAKLRGLINAVIAAPANDPLSQNTLRNFVVWTDGVSEFCKEIMLLAVEKKSHFGFDIIYWIKNTANLILGAMNSPAANERTREALETQARNLIFVLSWLPDDRDSVAYLAGYKISEILFDIASTAIQRGSDNCLEAATDTLLNWGFKGGRHQLGWAIMEETIKALSILALRNTETATANAAALRGDIQERLTRNPDFPIERRARIANSLRETAAQPFQRGSFQLIDSTMSSVPETLLRNLLLEIADILNPRQTN